MTACSTRWASAATAPRCRSISASAWPASWAATRPPTRSPAPGPPSPAISARPGSCRWSAPITACRTGCTESCSVFGGDQLVQRIVLLGEDGLDHDVAEILLDPDTHFQQTLDRLLVVRHVA